MLARNVVQKLRVLLLLVMVFSLASYTFVHNFLTKTHATHIDSEIVVAAGAYAQTNPVIYGNYVVWQEDRNDNQDIYTYNISTKVTEKIVTDDDDEANQANPAIWGDNIAFMDDRSGDKDIYVYNLTSKTETAVCTDDSEQYNPAIYGTKVIWVDDRNADGQNGKYDIYYKADFASVAETRVTPSGFVSTDGSLVHPFLSGTKIVWQGGLDGATDIYMYDIVEKQITQITATTAPDLYPAVYGDTIMWQRMVSGKMDLWTYDIPTKIAKQLTTGVTVDTVGSAMNGTRYVWADNRNDTTDANNKDARMFDVSNGEEKRISYSEKISTVTPAVYGDKIVWSDNRNDSKGDIYMATLVVLTTPTFANLPDSLTPINVAPAQVITTNPFVLKVKPTDDSGIKKVDFYVDENLICSPVTADTDGTYSCSWNTALHHGGVIRVVATNNQDRASEITVTSVVSPSLYLTNLPKTGEE